MAFEYTCSTSPPWSSTRPTTVGNTAAGLSSRNVTMYWSGIGSGAGWIAPGAAFAPGPFEPPVPGSACWAPAALIDATPRPIAIATASVARLHASHACLVFSSPWTDLDLPETTTRGMVLPRRVGRNGTRTARASCLVGTVGSGSTSLTGSNGGEDEQEDDQAQAALPAQQGKPRQTPQLGTSVAPGRTRTNRPRPMDATATARR